MGSPAAWRFPRGCPPAPPRAGGHTMESGCGCNIQDFFQVPSACGTAVSPFPLRIPKRPVFV